MSLAGTSHSNSGVQFKIKRLMALNDPEGFFQVNLMGTEEDCRPAKQNRKPEVQTPVFKIIQRIELIYYITSSKIQILAKTILKGTKMQVETL